MLVGLNFQKILSLTSHVSGPTTQWNSTLFPLTLSSRYGFGVFDINECIPFYNRAINFLYLAIKHKNYAIMSGSTHLNKRPLGSFPNYILMQHWMGGFLTNYNKVKEKRITSTHFIDFLNLIESIFRKRLLFKLKTKLKTKKNQIINDLFSFCFSKLQNKLDPQKRKKTNSFSLFFFEKQYNLTFQKKNFDSYKNLIQKFPDVTTMYSLFITKFLISCETLFIDDTSFLLNRLKKTKIKTITKYNLKKNVVQFLPRKKMTFPFYLNFKFALCKVYLVDKIPSVIISTDLKGSNFFAMNEARRLRLPYIAPISSYDGYAGVPYFLPLGRLNKKQSLAYFILFYKALMGIKFLKNSKILFWRNW